jgi:hypothetical protein
MRWLGHVVAGPCGGWASAYFMTTLGLDWVGQEPGQGCVRSMDRLDYCFMGMKLLFMPSFLQNLTRKSKMYLLNYRY